MQSVIARQGVENLGKAYQRGFHTLPTVARRQGARSISIKVLEVTSSRKVKRACTMIGRGESKDKHNGKRQSRTESKLFDNGNYPSSSQMRSLTLVIVSHARKDRQRIE